MPKVDHISLAERFNTFIGGFVDDWTTFALLLKDEKVEEFYYNLNHSERRLLTRSIKTFCRGAGAKWFILTNEVRVGLLRAVSIDEIADLYGLSQKNAQFLKIAFEKIN